MRSLICFALMLFPLASFAASGPEQLFKIRYQAFAISSELLLYYNPNQGAGDPRRAAPKVIAEVWRACKRS